MRIDGPLPNSISKEQLLGHLDDLLRTAPALYSLPNDDGETLSWLGRAKALVRIWDSTQSIFFDGFISSLNDMRVSDKASKDVMRMLNQARFDVMLHVGGPMTMMVPQGNVFQYFDEIRKVLETARVDVLFVDPYIDAEFVSNYLPHVANEVSVRLLAREKLTTLLPAVEMMRRERKCQIEVRVAAGFHDRYLFVDRQRCFHSGASFKDGGKSAPTMLTQVLDAFGAVSSTYETIWQAAKVK